MPSQDESKTPPEVEIHDEPAKEDIGVIVDLNKKEDQPKPDQSQLSVEELRKLHNRSEYLNRNLERTLKQVQTMVSQMQSGQTNQSSSQTQSHEKSGQVDELDQIAEKDWKQAVRILAEQVADEKLTARQKAELTQRTEQERIMTLNKSKSNVLSKYPNIDDETSQESKIYAKVLEENPDLLSNVRGPELAMYKMEERLKSSDPILQQKENMDEIDKEVQRRMRISASSVPAGRPAADNKIVLTTLDKEYCDRNGIPYEQFAKMTKVGPAGFREGVSV